MFYSLNHEDKVEQGDLCFNLPKIIPSDFISEEPTDSTWSKYIENIKNNQFSSVKFSFFPSPTKGVVLSQTCDIENSKEGSSIVFAELNKYGESCDFTTAGKKKQKSYIKNMLKLIRYEKPTNHYFPELILNNNKKFGPWELDFNNIFFVPTDLVKNNINLFWKARLITPAVEVLKEKIRHFFTRLAFEECIFLSDSETESYIINEKRDRSEIMKTRRLCGL